MSDWGRGLYGDPCRECGFGWSISIDDAIAVVVKVPIWYRETLFQAKGTERHPALAWSVTAYVLHVADNLRVWAERLAGVAAGAPPQVAPYSENELAAARRYEQIPLQAALWSLNRAVSDWQVSVEQAVENDVTLEHPERGEVTVLDVTRSNAHDALHHLWDIERSLRA